MKVVVGWRCYLLVIFPHLCADHNESVSVFSSVSALFMKRTLESTAAAMQHLRFLPPTILKNGMFVRPGNPL